MNRTIKHPRELSKSAQEVLKAHLRLIEVLTTEKALEIVPVFISRLIDITLGKVPYGTELIGAPDVVLKDAVAKEVHMAEWEAIRNAVVTAWVTAINTSEDGAYDEDTHELAAHYLKAVEAAPTQFKMPALYDVDYKDIYFLQLFSDGSENEGTPYGSYAFDQDTGAWATFSSEKDAHECAAEALDDEEAGYESYKLRRPVGELGFTEVVYASEETDEVEEPNFTLD